MFGLPKPLIYLIILTTILGALSTAYHMVWDAGYTEAYKESLEAHAENTKKAVEKAKVDWESSAKATEIVIQKETEIIEVVKTVYKDVYKTEYICEDVGANVLELLNRPMGGVKDEG